MSRTERLFTLLQILRTYRYPVSGQRLAERLGISIRTLYRDIATLQSQGAEIEGEPGIGYILKPSFFLPPLMFTQAEIEAIMLGIQWVSRFGDAPLSKGANHALAKITAVLPSNIRNSMDAVTLRVGPPAGCAMENEDLSYLREAIRAQRKIRITYKSKEGKQSQSILWPFSIGYFTDGRILVGWCEKQKDYRHFRTSSITSLTVLEERYGRPRESLFREWHSSQMQKHSLEKKD